MGRSWRRLRRFDSKFEEESAIGGVEEGPEFEADVDPEGEGSVLDLNRLLVEVLVCGNTLAVGIELEALVAEEAGVDENTAAGEGDGGRRGGGRIWLRRQGEGDRSGDGWAFELKETEKRRGEGRGRGTTTSRERNG